MYADLVRNKLAEQQDVYRSVKENDYSTVCYGGYKDGKYGLKDRNYTNRLRLSYYLLYEKIDDEEVTVHLFPRATSQVAARVRIFGDCRESQISRY